MTYCLKFTDKEISDLSVILNLDKEVVRNAVLINYSFFHVSGFMVEGLHLLQTS